MNTGKQNSGLLGMAVRCSVYKKLKKISLLYLPFLYFPGVILYFFLKLRLKYERLSNPQAQAISRILSSAARSIFAADTALTETFLRIGIDELSVSPSFVLKVRDTVRSIDLSKN